MKEVITFTILWTIKIYSIKCVEEQTGGNNIDTNNIKIYKITYYENKLNKIYDGIILSSIL